MARKYQKARKISGESLIDRSGEHIFPTSVRKVMSDGRLVGEDGSVWAFYSVPMSPITDAKTVEAAMSASRPLAFAISELSQMTPTAIGPQNRRFQKRNYRECQVFLTNIPAFFGPPIGHPGTAFLRYHFPNQTITNRSLLLGVKLKESLTDSGVKAALDSIAHTFFEGGTLVSDFDKDFQRVTVRLQSGGLRLASREEIRVAMSWWNGAMSPDSPVIPDGELLHVTSNARISRQVHRLLHDDVPKDEWPRMNGHHALRFASVLEIDPGYITGENETARWASHLVRQGALMVSARFMVEPGKITARELDAKEKKYTEDVKERYEAGKMSKPEQDERLDVLRQLRDVYTGASAPPTLTEMSVIAAFPESVGPVEELSVGPITITGMPFYQLQALAETWLTSPIKGNPNLIEQPASSLAYSGIMELSTVGTSPKNAPLVGFTEEDRQPAWFNMTEMLDQDTPPVAGFFGMSGSGKTMLGIWVAVQHFLTGKPVVFIDPKQGSDHTDIFEANGGRVISLDSLLSSDGILDPMRFATNRTEATSMASAMLSNVNIWGTDIGNLEREISIALNYGYEMGRRSIGTALIQARNDGKCSDAVALPVIDYAENNPLFRALVGLKDDGDSINVSDGLTLIKVGNSPLALPDDVTNAGLDERLALNVVRMLVKGTATALRGTDGAVFLDEAWIFLNSSKHEVESLGRLARSQRTIIGLLTQKVSDASYLDEFLTAGFILPLRREEETRVACRLLNLEPTPERITRITSSAVAAGATGEMVPNWDSMHALFDTDPRTGKKRNVRGSVAIYSDMHDRAVYTEIVLPPTFLDVASTNRADIIQRRQLSDDARVSG